MQTLITNKVMIQVEVNLGLDTISTTIVVRDMHLAIVGLKIASCVAIAEETIPQTCVGGQTR